VFSLQRLVGGDGDFFTLLETSAELSVLSAKTLIEMLPQPGDAWSLNRFHEIRRKNQTVTDDIFKLLCRSFVTPLDREDLENLASALYRIPKTLEKFTDHLLASRSLLEQVNFSRQIPIIAQATDTLLEMVKDVPHSPETVRVKQQNDRLHQLEGEADRLLLDLIKDLFSGRYEPVKVVALCSLYELLEKAVDRCRDAGNVLFRMALKLS
jgi:uncharacterized protein